MPESVFPDYELIDGRFIKTIPAMTVELRPARPRWLPARIHRWLLRQIVVIETPMTVETIA